MIRCWYQDSSWGGGFGSVKRVRVDQEGGAEGDGHCENILGGRGGRSKGLAKEREFFFLIGGFWGLRGINQLAIVCRATVLLGDMVVVVAGVVGLLILVVEVLIHVAVAVVKP